MRNRLPGLFTGSKICIICKGNEEYSYLKKIISLELWDSRYLFSLENARGEENVSACYQDKYQNGGFDLVLVFCIKVKNANEQYAKIKQKINEIHGKKQTADEVFMLLELDNKDIDLIQSITSVKNCKGEEVQRKELFSGTDYGNINELMQWNESSYSANFLKYLECFKKNDSNWIRRINSILER